MKVKITLLVTLLTMVLSAPISAQFIVTDYMPFESTKVATTATLTLTFSKEISLATTNDIDVYINKELANDACTWSVNSSNTLALNPNEDWTQGNLITVYLNPTVKSADGAIFDGEISEYEFIVDTENNFGLERITIPTLVTRNNGTHNIPIRIALPKDRTHKVPVQFWVHGGGWNGGTATESLISYGPNSNYLADELGVATIEIAYRCKGSGGTFTLAMEDIDEAYQWALDNAEKYNLDISNSFFSGGSAGTPLSSLAAQRYPNIKAYVGFNGVYNFISNPGSSFPSPNNYAHCTPSCEDNSALYNLKENPPITLLLHGDNDGTINHTQSLLFAEAIRNAGGSAEAIIYEGETHAFFNQEKVQYEDCLYEVAKFLKINGIVQNNETSTIGNQAVQPIVLFPNPASENITIKTNTLTGKTQLTLFNSTGKIVSSYTINTHLKQDYKLTVATLTRGIYILNIKDEAGQNINCKLVVNSL